MIAFSMSALAVCNDSGKEKAAKTRRFHRIIVKFIFAHTALFAYSVMLCNRYPAIQVCK